MNRIKELRKSSKITQEQLAEILGIKRENISRWENNAAQPSRENLIKFADYFSVTTDYLLGREILGHSPQQSGQPGAGE